MSGRMEIDTDRVRSLARVLADAADGLSAAARTAADVPPLGPSPTAWADAAARHDAGLAAVADTLGVLADRAATVADALVAAVGATRAQDAQTARSIADASGERS
ncbi:hypothetical protein [uncultured Williamsia sp.]|uniref:hypothetical protein n=1 Tax=uncultured Williamsia sp. TaxID=259311 RepID=UPI002618218F|nr:hypothetical protein [uncultured Williamsia sp.]